MQAKRGREMDDLGFVVVGRTRFELVTSSVSGLLRVLVHVRQARLQCLEGCPGVTMMTLGGPPHRARSGHGARRPGARRLL